MSLTLANGVEVVLLSNWLDWSCSADSGPFIALPMIQRGSVWRPQQVIELWDSLLRGMPVGSMMVSALKEGTPIRRPGRNASENVPKAGGLALIDGQQRSLAMLIAWSSDIEMDRRLWVDFAQRPAPGQLLHLRMTTSNQPFGFRINEPSRKLSLSDKRIAQSAFYSKNGKEVEVTVKSAWPFSHTASLPLDLRQLVSLWRNSEGNVERWAADVTEALEKVQIPKLVDRDQNEWASDFPWSNLDGTAKSAVFRRIRDLASGLGHLFDAELPLIRVPERFFETAPDEDSDPPLAVLFKRIAGGTPLSDADYVYSVIKHLRPETFDLVESLQGHNRTVASLLTATDLVMSAVRLATVGWHPPDGRPVPDVENLSKGDFHRLLRRGDFIDERFLPLIRVDGHNSIIATYFESIQSLLLFKGGEDQGLPKQAFPVLKRPLVQVLLMLAQSGHLRPDDTSVRYDILRLVLYWIVAVGDPHKASRLAYDVISSSSANDTNIGEQIYNRLLTHRAGAHLPTPQDLEIGTSPSSVLRSTGKVLGESRFQPRKDDEDHRLLLQFYRNHWWRPSTYEHPILLWLQRKMVAAKFDTKVDPLAGRDEDTPYDYDHILPYNHWGGWTGAKRGATLLDFVDGEIHVLGNGIGNLRVWGSSLNRSDGSKSPTMKLKLDCDDAERASLLGDSCIEIEEAENWKIASGTGDLRSWTAHRALAFQAAAEHRAIWLYRRFYEDLQFALWEKRPA
jgi:hypothetical protein